MCIYSLFKVGRCCRENHVCLLYTCTALGSILTFSASQCGSSHLFLYIYYLGPNKGSKPVVVLPLCCYSLSQQTALDQSLSVLQFRAQSIMQKFNTRRSVLVSSQHFQCCCLFVQMSSLLSPHHSESTPPSNPPYASCQNMVLTF